MVVVFFLLGYEDGTENSETSTHKIQTTQKKQYSIQNAAKVWNQENTWFLWKGMKKRECLPDKAQMGNVL